MAPLRATAQCPPSWTFFDNTIGEEALQEATSSCLRVVLPEVPISNARSATAACSDAHAGSHPVTISSAHSQESNLLFNAIRDILQGACGACMSAKPASKNAT